MGGCHFGSVDLTEAGEQPDQATEIRELFDQNDNPSFDIINAIGGGINWPTLQAALGAEGAANLLFPRLNGRTGLREEVVS